MSQAGTTFRLKDVLDQMNTKITDQLGDKLNKEFSQMNEKLASNQQLVDQLTNSLSQMNERLTALEANVTGLTNFIDKLTEGIGAA